MNLSSIKYLIKEGFKNLLNNIFMAMASIGVLTACLLIVGFSVLLKMNTKKIITFMGQQSTIVIYLKDGADNEKINKLSNSLKEHENTNSLEFISKEQALEIFSKRYKNETAKEALLKNNVLPASINVHIKNVENLEDVLKVAEDKEFLEIIEQIKTPTKYANAVKEFDKTTKFFGTVLIIALIAASLLIISNTIRAAIFSRRREIAIMKQVGATNSFVRFPFIVEGIIIGAISAVIAFVLTAVFYKAILSLLTKYSSDFLNSMFSTLVTFKNVSSLIAINFLIYSILTGALASIICLKRYLKF